MAAATVMFAIAALAGQAASAAVVPGVALGADGNESGAGVFGGINAISFTTNAPVQVTALGLYDAALFTGDGFGAAHTLALYRQSDQQELGRITLGVGQTGTPVDGFRYVNLASPVTLAANTRYEVAALYAPSVGFTDNDGLRGGVSFTPDARLTNVTTQTLGSNPGQPFPDVQFISGDLGTAFFGPNLLVTAVPEPLALPLAAFTLGSGLLGRRRRDGR